MKNVLKVAFWIISLILFPITAGLYFIWPSKIFREKMSNGWMIFCWIAYAVLAFIGVASKIILLLFAYAYATNYKEYPYILYDNIPASDYRTSEDFYKLTGVEFPELEMVDSLRFCDEPFPPRFL